MSAAHRLASLPAIASRELVIDLPLRYGRIFDRHCQRDLLSAQAAGVLEVAREHWIRGRYDLALRCALVRALLMAGRVAS